jgi:hypothetical protein
MQHGLRDDGTVHIDIDRHAILDPPTNSLYDLREGITKAAWCHSEKAPGVVAVGCGSGLIIVEALDQFLLVE